MDVLRLGSRGPRVKQLQEALNLKLAPSPKLNPDGAFGNLTLAAVKRFQAQCWLVVDGEAGACTWNAATGGETYTPIHHALPFIPQPTNSTCWAASTAMLCKSSVPMVISKTPSDLILPDGSLANKSEQSDWLTDTRRYSQAHGLRYLAPQSWGLDMLRSKMSQGPLMFDMLWSASDYTAGVGSSGHMIVIVGMRGDDDPTGKGTTLRIHDPWKPNQGKIYSVGHYRWMQEVPTRTYRVFHR